MTKHMQTAKNPNLYIDIFETLQIIVCLSILKNTSSRTLSSTPELHSLHCSVENCSQDASVVWWHSLETQADIT